MKKIFRVMPILLLLVSLITFAIPQNKVFANNDNIAFGENEASNYVVHTTMESDKQAVAIDIKIEAKENINIQKVTLPDKSEVSLVNSSITYRALENGTYVFTVYYTKTEGTSSEVINDKNQTNEILTVDITVDVDDIEKLIEKESSENIEKSKVDQEKVAQEKVAQEKLNKENVLKETKIEDSVQVSTWAELETALLNKDNIFIEITKDIEIEDEILIQNGRTVHFTGVGRLVRSEKLDKSLHMINIEEGGNVYIEGITIDGNNVGDRFMNMKRVATAIEISGKLTLVSGTITRHTCYVIHMQGKNAEFHMQGGIITENEASSGLLIEDHATFIMDGGEITKNSFDNWSDMEENGIYLLNGSKFILNNGYITNNICDGLMSGIVNVSGGRSNRDEDAASFVMNGGEISNNYSNRTAGGVTVGTWLNPDYITVANFQMNGGKISNNTSRFSGGGVFILCNGEFEMNNGEIINNQAPMGGGVSAFDAFVAMGAGDAGFDINDWGTKYNCPAAFTMNGGVISGNSTNDAIQADATQGTGGGVYVASNKVTLNAGKITNNKAEDQGGGVYVGSIPYELHMYNTLITDNDATLLGGGIWSCPTGSVQIHVNNGGALFDNNALTNAAGDDYVSVPRSDKYITTLAERMLGGGSVTYYEDGKVLELGVLGKPDPSVSRFDPANPGEPIKNISNSKETYALKVDTTQNAKEIAKDAAKLIISGNTSVRGGGIGTNGSVVIGEEENNQTIHVEKQWATIDGKTPTVKVDLIRIDQNGNRTILDTVELNETNNWKVTFNHLPLQYTYDVEEHAMEGYRATYEKVVSENEISIIIKNTQSTIEKKVTKVWNDSNNQDGIRPNEVKVQLLANGKAFGEVLTMNEKSNWSASWKDLPKYESGKEIKYTIKELDTISGYESKIESDKDGNFILTNTHAVELINKTVAKIWNDSNNQDGIRPNEVKVQLLANGKAFGEVLTLNEKSNWSASWKDLPKFESGKDINYSIKEVTISDGYTSKTEIDKNGDFIITNTHVPESPITPEKPDEPTKPKDEYTPSNNKAPQTGDFTNVSLYLVFVSTSIIAMSLIFVKKRKLKMK